MRAPVRRRQSSMAARSSFTRRRLPMKLSSTRNTSPFQPARRRASSSSITRPGALVRGTRPFMATMSQNSQLNGHPRENCTDMPA